MVACRQLGSTNAESYRPMVLVGTYSMYSTDEKAMHRFKMTRPAASVLTAILLAIQAQSTMAQTPDTDFPREFTFLDEGTMAIVCTGTLNLTGRAMVVVGQQLNEPERRAALEFFKESTVWAAEAAAKGADRAMIERIMNKLKTDPPHEAVFAYCIRKADSKFEGMTPSQQNEVKLRAEKTLQSLIKR